MSHPSTSPPSPLPSLLRTPFGLAILEIQGTVHVPFPQSPSSEEDQTQQPTGETEVGRLEFPLLENLHDKSSIEDTGWMNRVYLYVGKNQRLTGEVKKLGKPLGVIRKRDSDVQSGDNDADMTMDDEHANGVGKNEEELEIVDVIEYKILFQSRPEPVGD